MQKEWNIWVAALSSYEPDFLQKFLEENPSYYWYSSPPAYFGASMGVLDALKILVGRGEVYAFPNIFYFDMKLGKLMSWSDMAQRRASIREVWDKGIDEVIRVAKTWSL